MLNLDDRELNEVLTIAQTSIERVQALIADLSQLEHIDSGIDFETKPTPMSELIEYACADVYPKIAAKRLGFAVVLQPNLPPILLEPRLIRTALVNYLDNAITAANTRVLLNVYTNAPMLHIEVSDDGPGVAPEVQGRLFERFYRPNRTRDTATGLGLAIVKSVAEAHGGSVYLQSAPNEGSVFGFTLRMTAAAAPGEAHPASAVAGV
jgi:signal transduction histidine kinase